MTSTDPTQRFSDRVEFYIRSRPRYPAALLRFFQEELSLTPAQTIADIGAGTGILTELFVRNGNLTYAVEPNDAMRTAAEAALGDQPNFRSVRGTAETTTLPPGSVHFVTAGQAFHWFDAEAARLEFSRILAAGGVVALVWNERHVNGSPFAASYEQLVQQYHVDAAAVKRRHMTMQEDASIASFFGSRGFAVRSFENPQVMDRTGLIDRLASASYMPLPPDPRHADLLRAANELFDRHQRNGAIVMPHDTRVYFGRISV
jgi:SAM-dependent methyltransferase